MKYWASVVLVSVLWAVPGRAEMSPNPFQNGPYAVSTGEYHLPAAVNPDILPDRMTELWAKAYLPKLNNRSPLPVLVFLHGNHGTCGSGVNPRRDNSCEYTDSGTCPAGMVVTPNHEGYSYVAEHLASWGFAVFSINANRGITCGGGFSGDFGLNLARGRLILSHLAQLREWATKGGAPGSMGIPPNGLVGRLQFANVGLMGHSRGGEGARAAYTLYNDAGSPWKAKVPGLEIRAIFEIGAVDGQTDRVLDADQAAWNQILPMCDGDVSDLEGRNPFERMIAKKGLPLEAQKSLIMVYGANHNFFNTEWQVSDSDGCRDHQPVFPPTMGSKVQTSVAGGAMSSFFRGNLMGDRSGGFEEFNQLFNPLFQIFNGMTSLTRLDRDFAETVPAARGASMVAIGDDFDKAPKASSQGVPVQFEGLDASSQRLGSEVPTPLLKVEWKSQGTGVFYQTNFTVAPSGVDASGFSVLEFRASPPISDGEPQPTPSDFSVNLVMADGRSSKSLPVSKYADLIPPGSFTQLLQTVRMPLVDFGVTRRDVQQLRGVRFTFDQQASGSMLLANLRFSRFAGLGARVISPPTTAGRVGRPGRRVPGRTPVTVARGEWIPAAYNRVIGTRRVNEPGRDGRPVAYVEIELSSRVPFEARDELYVLRAGNQEFKLSRYPDGQLNRIRFLVPERLAGAVRGGMTVRLGPLRHPVRTWQF